MAGDDDPGGTVSLQRRRLHPLALAFERLPSPSRTRSAILRAWERGRTVFSNPPRARDEEGVDRAGNVRP
jgi:hypothetical protein